MAAQQRQQPALTVTARLPMRHQAGQIRPMHQKPFEPPPKSRQSFQQFRLEGLDRKQRDQADHGTDAQAHALIVGQAENIVEELIFIVPQAHIVAEHAAHRLSYP